MVENVIIMGAAGRDFHNFNVYFKNNPRYKVMAFTHAQITDISERYYPVELAGKLYSDNIPIFPEAELAGLIEKYSIDLVAFSYSDISHQDVMQKASIAMAKGADFILLGATFTMIKSKKPVISICAVRTGCGKSQTTRKVCSILQSINKKAAVVRHPMPYGDLRAQVVQRFSSYDDFKEHNCTIEEREEYEPLVDQGTVVYAGVDYQQILDQAEQESDVVIWDGGNNDTPFYTPTIQIVVFDPHRAGHELLYYPGHTNMLMAHIAIINKVDTASPEQVAAVRKNIELYNPGAQIIEAESTILVDKPDDIRGKRVLIVEDGPTLTHGEMSFGAGTIAAERFGAGEIIDPRPFAVGSISEVYKRFPHITQVIPAMGYNPEQVKDLETSINNSDCDLVLFGTPIDLTSLLSINKPTMRVRYEYGDHGAPLLEDIIKGKL
ncbi:MAG: GTPase [bacterium]|nr:GTPase [bacterium]